MQYPAIAIIGGGLGGLTLAAILHRHGVRAEVYERDADPGYRPQGGSLDIHPDTGRRALQAAGVIDGFEKLARYGDQGNRLYASDGTLLFADANRDGDRPEIDRSQLRDLLLAALPPDAVHWDSKVTAIAALPDGRHGVTSAAGREMAFDLVVGADGGGSVVRSIVSPARPTDTGVVIVDLGIDDADRRHPDIAGMVGRGKMFAKAPGRTIAAQRADHGHIRVYAALRGTDGVAPPDIRRWSKPELLAQFSAFAPRLRAILAAGQVLATRPIHTLPIGHCWASRPGVTLIGDAAHLKAPFGGEGANGAMADAADLAAALLDAIAGGCTLAVAIADYERIMVPRAASAASLAADGLRNGVSTDGDAALLDHLRAAPLPTPAVKTTPQTMFDTRIAAMTRDLAIQDRLDAIYRIDLGGTAGGHWIVDFTATTAGIRKPAATDRPQCSLAMTDDHFVAMVSGVISPRMAFMTGKLKVRGDMGLAMKFGHVLTD